MKLNNKVAVITGAASGIGRACANMFAQEGARVVVADINDAAGKETVADIRSRGGDAIFVHVDVTVASGAKNLIKTVIANFGKIDILFNNAGIVQKSTEIENIDEALWDRIYSINVKSIFNTAKYAIPEMKKAGCGVIINNGSISGVRPRPLLCAYASSKGAVNTLTQAMALELAPSNIRVNCINHVMTDTPMLDKLPPGNMSKEEYLQGIMTTIPLGRIAKPEDVAYAALYLASDESAMITGTSIDVSGGRGI